MPKKVDMICLKVLPLHLPLRADRNDGKMNLRTVMVRAVNKGLNIQSKTSYYDNMRKIVGRCAKCIRSRDFSVRDKILV